MNKLTVDQLRLLQALPFEVKLARATNRIIEYVSHYGKENVYVSFSAGLQSFVIADITHSLYPDIPLVFVNTGLEFPEIVDYANSYNNVVTVKPKMVFPEVIKKYGYPILSKQVSGAIYKVRHHNLNDRYKNYLLNGDERGKYGMIPKMHQHLINSDIEIGNGCCAAMKKRPLHQYEKESGRFAPITGEMAEENRDRKLQYLKYGCNAFDRKQGPKCTPLGPWVRNDCLLYAQKVKKPICKIYGEIEQIGQTILRDGTKIPQLCTTGEQRTGCIFCGYGCHREPKDNNRFIRLKKSHPAIYDYCMRGGIYNEKGIWIPDKGLGMRHVLDLLKVNY